MYIQPKIISDQGPTLAEALAILNVVNTPRVFLEDAGRPLSLEHIMKKLYASHRDLLRPEQRDVHRTLLNFLYYCAEKKQADIRDVVHNGIRPLFAKVEDLTRATSLDELQALFEIVVHCAETPQDIPFHLRVTAVRLAQALAPLPQGERVGIVTVLAFDFIACNGERSRIDALLDEAVLWVEGFTSLALGDRSLRFIERSLRRTAGRVKG